MYLTADRLVTVRELSRSNNYTHQSSLIKLSVHIESLHWVTEVRPMSILSESTILVTEVDWSVCSKQLREFDTNGLCVPYREIW